MSAEDGRCPRIMVMKSRQQWSNRQAQREEVMGEAGDIWEAGRGWTGNACERNFPSMLG